MTRPISPRAALSCEMARTPRCRCRCGGELHGAKRLAADATEEALTTLPEHDPHFVSASRLAELREPKPRRTRGGKLIVGEQLDLCDIADVWT